MNGMYNLSNGKLISLYLHDNDFSEEYFFNETTVHEIDRESMTYKPNSERTVEIKQDEFTNRQYIEYDGDRVYLMDFLYKTADELVEYLKESRKRSSMPPFFEDTILASFLRDGDNIGIIIDMQYRITSLFDFCLISDGDNEVRCLCKATESEYPKYFWNQKISIDFANEDFRKVFRTRNMYFTDFCHDLYFHDKDGVYWIDLVNYNEYREVLHHDYLRYLSYKKEQEEHFIERVKSFLGIVKPVVRPDVFNIYTSSVEDGVLVGKV